MFNYIKIISILYFFINIPFSQSYFNLNPTKRLLFEKKRIFSNDYQIKKYKPFEVTFNQSFFLNTNLPNLENLNGLYVPKGIGKRSSLIFYHISKYFEMSFEPRIIQLNQYNNFSFEKPAPFNVLNDVPLSKEQFQELGFIDNFGLKFNYKDFEIGYGNWDQWWGPGIHSGIIMTNNSTGMRHLTLGTKSFIPLAKNILINFNFKQYDHFYNELGAKYFHSLYSLRLKYLNYEFGLAKSILSGGYPEIKWNYFDAFKSIIPHKKDIYWDYINDFYVVLETSDSGIVVFVNLALPNRTFNNKNPKFYDDHSRGSNIGFRKHGAFGNENVLFGFEYTRLLQSIYYNIIPSSNWYDNIKYNYSAFRGRRWAAHSGTDSDDFIFYGGLLNDKYSAILGWNYERHGAGNHFPPEVKLESRFSFSVKIKSMWLYIYYEDEYFEHYGFVDDNLNVWTETFEKGSIQRTKTLLFSIEYRIN